MRLLLTTLCIVLCATIVQAQEERDTVLPRCPVFITDTVSVNNFFLEFQPSTVKVQRNRGRLIVVVEQRDQYFTLFFRDKKLRTTRYRIVTDPDNKSEVAAKYSFRSGESASYVDVSSGAVDVNFDKEKNFWRVKVNGMMANIAARSVTYYKVKAELLLK